MFSRGQGKRMKVQHKLQVITEGFNKKTKRQILGLTDLKMKIDNICDHFFSLSAPMPLGLMISLDSDNIGQLKFAGFTDIDFNCHLSSKSGGFSAEAAKLAVEYSVYCHLANIEYGEGREELARAYWNKALKVKPGIQNLDEQNQMAVYRFLD